MWTIVDIHNIVLSSVVRMYLGCSISASWIYVIVSHQLSVPIVVSPVL